MKIRILIILTIIVFSFNNLFGNPITPNDTIAKNIVISDVFSINKENSNNVYYVNSLNKSVIKTFKMEIYNRWGENVCTITNIDQGWDGFFKGSILPSGVYLYNINCELFDSNNQNQITEIKNHTGTISLIR
ncbi:MAG: gliding motility-associated C-terminal domain-containing protein [Bacteroidia bacterium]|nr:gliding motility-associated C-terminal domain-containing protein [Bacteroidia bacterium]